MTPEQKERLTNKQIEIADVCKDIVELENKQEKLKQTIDTTQSEILSKVLLRFKLVHQCDVIKSELVV